MEKRPMDLNNPLSHHSEHDAPPKPPKQDPKPKKHNPVIHNLIEKYAKEHQISYKDAEAKIGGLTDEELKNMLEHKK